MFSLLQKILPLFFSFPDTASEEDKPLHIKVSHFIAFPSFRIKTCFIESISIPKHYFLDVWRRVAIPPP
jgi:hypothetical protein